MTKHECIRWLAKALTAPSAIVLGGAVSGVTGAVLAIVLTGAEAVFVRFLLAAVGGGACLVGHWEWLVPKLKRIAGE